MTERLEQETQTHPFPPVFYEDTQQLILGSFPSVKSRENQFFYGHPQNRFWKVLAALTEEAVPVTVEEKKALLRRNRIGIWDVIHSCDIIGSSDSSIKNVVPNRLETIFDHCNIKTIYANGKKSAELYKKYSLPVYGREIITLPSTSPANAVYRLDKLIDAWKIIKYL